ncbi:MAG: hypothetical protein ABW217_09560 [Polyangiaceae bacterium]
MMHDLARKTLAFRTGRNLVATVALLAAAIASSGCSKTESPKPETAKLQPLPAEQTKASKKPKKKPPAPEWPAPVPGTFLVDPQRPLQGATAAGWQPVTDDGRTVVRLTEPKATVQFDLTPVPGDYVLTAVARVEGGKSAKVTPTLNGKALPAWSLTEDWAMYTSKVPKDLLAAGKDELALATGTSKEPLTVKLDTVSLAPIGDRATIEMGAPVGGLLIDGFYRTERGKVRWSRGKKSILGVVLAPGKGPYRLTMEGSGFPPISPISTTAVVNGKEVGTASFTKKFGSVSWDVPAGVLTAGLNRIELTYDKSGTPKAFGKSKDTRDLAVRIERLSIAPTP